MGGGNREGRRRAWWRRFPEDLTLVKFRGCVAVCGVAEESPKAILSLGGVRLGVCGGREMRVFHEPPPR